MSVFCHQCPVFTSSLPMTSPTHKVTFLPLTPPPLILQPQPSLVKLQTTPLRLTSTLHSEQIEVLFCCLVNILHTIGDICMTIQKKPVATTTTTNDYSICCWFFFQSLAIWSSLKLGMLASSSGKM